MPLTPLCMQQANICNLAVRVMYMLLLCATGSRLSPACFASDSAPNAADMSSCEASLHTRDQ